MKKYIFQSLKVILSFMVLLISENSVYSQLTVDFTFLPVDPDCSENSIAFTSTVTGGTEPYTYAWDFGDGSPNSNKENPSHVFDAFGCNNGVSYYVTLTVTDVSSTTATKSTYVIVNERPNPQIEDLLNEPDFDNCNNSPRPGDPFTIQVKDITTDRGCIVPGTGTLDYGDGKIEAGLDTGFVQNAHTYQKAGAYKIVLTFQGTNGCVGTTVDTVKHEAEPYGSIYVPSNMAGCAPVEYYFEISNIYKNSFTTYYIFDFGDGTVDTIYHDELCANDSTIYHWYNTSSCSLPLQWFTVQMWVQNTCGKKGPYGGPTSKIWAAPSAISDTIFLNGCIDDCFDINSTTIFTPAYGNNCSVDQSYFWDFGNGVTSTSSDPPCWYYPSDGVYIGWVMSSNDCGKDTVHFQVEVDPSPVADAEPDTTRGCVPFDVFFENFSTDGDLPPPWLVSPSTGWVFITNPPGAQIGDTTIRFLQKGIYTVTLQATNSCATDVWDTTITAMDKPVVTLNLPSEMCIFDTLFQTFVTYNNSHSTIDEWYWIFENGDPPDSDEEYPDEIRYVGTFPDPLVVKAAVMNECGWSDTVVGSIAMKTKADISGFIFANGTPVAPDTTLCQSDIPVRFGAIINGVSELPSNGWNSSPPNISPNGFFTPNVIGLFTVELISGPGNCADTSSFIIGVVEAPIVTVGNDTTICDETVPIPLYGNPPGGSWSAPATEIPPSSGYWYFQPAIPGIFSLNYTFRDQNSGCEGTGTMVIKYDRTQSAEFSYSAPDFCIGTDIIFSPISPGPLGTVYSWSFNSVPELPLSTPGNITKSFNVSGFVLVALTTTSPLELCQDTKVDTITITDALPDPFFTLTPNPVCGGKVFIDVDPLLTSLLNSIEVSSKWYIDNNTIPFSTDNIPSPNYIEFPSGAFDEDHSVTWDLEGCGAKNFTQTVTVLPVPTSLIRIDSSRVYSNEIFFLNETESYSYTDQKWILPDGSEKLNVDHIMVTIKQGEEYIIKLVTNNQICPDTAIASYKRTFKGLYIPNAFLPESTDTLVNQFKAVGIGLLSYNLAVYDTWGNQIWETSLIDENTEPAEGWDGTAKNGEPLPQDVYIWYARAVFIDNTIWQGQGGNTSGNVTLFR